MRNLEVFIMFTVLILSMGMVSAKAPVTTIFTGDFGINVEVQLMPSYEYGEARFSVIHLFNSTSGYQFNITTNPDITCDLHLRDSQGFELSVVRATPHLDHWDLNGTFGGMNLPGRYAWTLACNDDTNIIGGYISGYFDITNNGKVEPDAPLILGFMVIMLLIFIFSIVIMIRAIGLMIDAKLDILDVAYMWGLYFGLLGVTLFADIYLGNLVIQEFLELFIKIFAFPMVVLPVLGFFLSLFRNMKAQKKKEAEW